MKERNLPKEETDPFRMRWYGNVAPRERNRRGTCDRMHGLIPRRGGKCDPKQSLTRLFSSKKRRWYRKNTGGENESAGRRVETDS